MAGDDIAFLSALELLDLYRDKSLSPVEVASAMLDRIEEFQPKLNAFIVVDRDGALAAARASEARWRGGEPSGALDGVPVGIKDIMWMRGFPTRRGSRLTDPTPDKDDAPATARVREAGAVILGKTTSPEFGWKALGDSPLTGITRNPWDPNHTSGGSSAGAGAACAAGIAPLHVGTDGAGSIRTPSSFCGLAGLKPTFGRVPAHPPSAMGLLANTGPMTRSVRDAALLMNVLTRPDPRDPYALPAEDRDYLASIEDGVKGWRVAFSPDLGYARVDPEVAAAVGEGARQFEALGARVEQVGQIFPSPRDALLTIWGAGTAKLLASLPAERHHECDPGLIAASPKPGEISAVDYLNADAERTELGRRLGEFFQSYDLLVLPTQPVPALPNGQDLNDPATERHWIDWSPFSYPFNMARLPAATVPCGLTQAGLPIGLQIVGPRYADHRVLRAARAFETTQLVRRPPL
jgi:aspartyl-tRNA(Asn)/glutamyl-tRNA(Gln) amidotransferase subunit A